MNTTHQLGVTSVYSKLIKKGEVLMRNYMRFMATNPYYK